MKRSIVAAALAVLFAGTAEAAITEFIIYKEPNFRGPSHVVKGEVNVLESGFAKDASSLKVLGGFWYVCTEHHFQGDCRVLAPGDYPRLPPDLNNQIVSIRFLGNDPRVAQGKRLVRPEMVAHAEPQWEQRRDWRWEQQRSWEQRSWRDGSIDLYGRPDFRGRSVRIERSTPDLGDVNFDGRASSVVVNDGVWQLCTEPGFEGRCRVFRPGEYNHLAELDDRVSSVRRVR